MIRLYRARHAAVLLSLAVIFSACTPAARPSAPRPAPRLVYFAHPRPVEQPYPLAEWRESGALVVHRFSDLRAAVGAETEAIILDAAVADQVDRGWLRAEAWPPGSRVIVGVNLTLRELQEMVDAPEPQARWKPDEPHFAIVVFGPDCSAAGQERFSHFSPLSDFLGNWVERYVRCARMG